MANCKDFQDEAKNMEGNSPRADKDGVEIKALVSFEGEEDLQSKLDGHPQTDGAEGGYETVDSRIPRYGNGNQCWCETPVVL